MIDFESLRKASLSGMFDRATLSAALSRLFSARMKTTQAWLEDVLNVAAGGSPRMYNNALVLTSGEVVNPNQVLQAIEAEQDSVPTLSGADITVDDIVSEVYEQYTMASCLAIACDELSRTSGDLAASDFFSRVSYSIGNSGFGSASTANNIYQTLSQCKTSADVLTSVESFASLADDPYDDEGGEYKLNIVSSNPSYSGGSAAALWFNSIDIDWSSAISAWWSLFINEVRIVGKLVKTVVNAIASAARWVISKFQGEASLSKDASKEYPYTDTPFYVETINFTGTVNNPYFMFENLEASPEVGIFGWTPPPNNLKWSRPDLVPGAFERIKRPICVQSTPFLFLWVPDVVTVETGSQATIKGTVIIWLAPTSSLQPTVIDNDRWVPCHLGLSANKDVWSNPSGCTINGAFISPFINSSQTCSTTYSDEDMGVNIAGYYASAQRLLFATAVWYLDDASLQAVITSLQALDDAPLLDTDPAWATLRSFFWAAGGVMPCDFTAIEQPSGLGPRWHSLLDGYFEAAEWSSPSVDEAIDYGTEDADYATHFSNSNTDNSLMYRASNVGARLKCFPLYNAISGNTNVYTYANSLGKLILGRIAMAIERLQRANDDAVGFVNTHFNLLPYTTTVPNITSFQYHVTTDDEQAASFGSFLSTAVAAIAAVALVGVGVKVYRTVKNARVLATQSMYSAAAALNSAAPGTPEWSAALSNFNLASVRARKIDRFSSLMGITDGSSIQSYTMLSRIYGAIV